MQVHNKTDGLGFTLIVDTTDSAEVVSFSLRYTDIPEYAEDIAIGVTELKAITTALREAGIDV